MNNNPATEKQITFIKQLLAERVGNAGAEAIRDALNAKRVYPGGIDRDFASKCIDVLLNCTKNTEQVGEITEDGIYTHGDAIFKVYFTRETKQLVCKEFIRDEQGDPQWEYRGKAPLRLKGLVKMGHEDARKFGRMYGVCVNCLRDLNDERSVAAGYGQTCANNMGWWYPTKSEAIEILRTEGEVA